MQTAVKTTVDGEKISGTAKVRFKKLSCRRETARRSVSFENFH